jgi:hypothetical protein
MAPRSLGGFGDILNLTGNYKIIMQSNEIYLTWHCGYTCAKKFNGVPYEQ